MTSITELKDKYKDIIFKEYNKKIPMADNAIRVEKLDSIFMENDLPKELEYIWLDQDSEAATNNILKSLISMYVMGVSDSLNKLWESNGYQASAEDKETQITFLKAIAEQLYKGNSDEHIQLKEACYAKYFRQIILYDRNKNLVYAEDDSGKTPEEFAAAIELLDNIMSKLFKEMILDTDTEQEVAYS